MNTYGNTYIFEWIDTLISQIFDPQQNDFFIIDEKQMETWTVKIKQETIHLKSQLRNQLFSLNKRNKKQRLISEYYSALTLLLNHLLRYKKDNHFEQQSKQQMISLIQSVLEELLVFIETRYLSLINPEAQVSATCGRAIQEEMKRRMQELTNRLGPEHLKNAALEIVLQRFSRFIEGKLPEFKANYRTVFYKKALLKGLEELHWVENDSEDFSPLDKLLIYLNYNSKAYISFLINFIKGKVRDYNNPTETISILRFYQKAFKQIHPKPNTILNPGYYNLRTIINNWFEQEILYLKDTISLSNPRVSSSETVYISHQSVKEKQKIICNLSSDQMALILRAADEAKILMARSMSEVFKTIVPHLSTPHKQNLSYNAMRVKTYNVEDRDKEVAIQMLEMIINKIKTF